MYKFKLEKNYLIPTMIQTLVVAFLVFLLKKGNFRPGYDSAIGILLVALGGLASAIWGTVYQCKYNGKSIKRIAVEFFHIHQPLRIYGLVIGFLLIDFFGVIICRGFHCECLWTPVLLFVKAILVGGVEEVGWRYTFQAELEKRVSYVTATILTFASWGIWHILFFYIDGTLPGLSAKQMLFFLLGLLTNCFVLSCLFHVSGSLWMCVMTHALINVGAQLTRTDHDVVSTAAKLVCIGLAVLVVMSCGMRTK